MKNDQIKWGIVLSYVAQGITILSGLIYTPIMLRILGQSEYGLYQLSSSVISYLGLLNLGFSSGYLRLYFRFKKNDEITRINNLNGMYLVIFGIISLLSIIFGSILILSRNIMFSKKLTPVELIKMKPLMIIMVVTLVISFLSSVFECYITAYSEFVFQRALQVAKGILNPFISLPLLLLGYGSIAMVLVSCGLTVLSFICTVYYCTHKLRMKFSFLNIEKDVMKDLSNFTFYIFISTVVDKINLSLDNYLLGSLCGTIMVSIYGIGAQINGFYNMVSSSIASIFAPQINQIVADSNDNKKLTEIFTRISRVLFMILLIILIGFIFFGHKFIILWAGKKYSDSFLVALFLMIGSIIPLTQICGIEIQKAKNMHKARSIAYFLVALSNIGISIPLIKIFGAVGASIGTMVTMIIGSGLFMNWYYDKIIGLEMGVFWKRVMGTIPCYIISIMVGVVYTFINTQSLITYILFMVVFLLGFIISVFIMAKIKKVGVKDYIFK